MKTYTDIEQSKKLSEILPTESADMIYIMYRDGEKPLNGDADLSTVYESNDHKWYWIDFIDESWDMRIGEDIPSWSLSALLDIMPSASLDSSDDHYYRLYCMERFTEWYNNPIDACYEMILKLKENELI